MNKTLSSLAAAVLALSCAGAQATQASASATYSLTFRIVDLTPNDNVAAGYTLVDAQTSGGYRIAEGYDAAWASDAYDVRSITSDSVSGRFGTIAASAANAPSGGHATVDMAPNTFDGQVQARSYQLWDMVLKPHTALVVSGRYDISAHLGDLNVDQAYLDGIASFWLAGRAGDNGQGGTYAFSVDETLGRYEWENGTRGEYFSFSLANTGDAGLAASVSVFAGAEARHYLDSPLPVPEPATYMMLGAGLAVAAVAARRRRLG